ncbi:nucleotidyltransferase family protein [Curtobacterium sp. BRD11]|uniref:nucleotidyltransferase family protein n=1 Tax=Curtobacterium sp. BRD11 TaxID=2962581 RepID=UPI002880C81F|nr:nucleotidyltransferase family protein [Curtobacterium sp. BRD11]MDT0212065.1 nucleotidyltransferase family protein [Curtobacterium sp. BRD11]
MPTAKVAVVPCAGRGTRLRPLSDTIPKPVLPLGERPALFHIVEEAIQAEISRVILVVPADPLLQRLAESALADVPVKVDFLTQKRPTGLGTAVSLACRYLASEGEERFLLQLPDVVRKPHALGALKVLQDIATESGHAALSLSSKFVSEASQHGVVEVRESGPLSAIKEVTNFIEKPRGYKSAKSDIFIAGGRYAFATEEILRALPESLLRDATEDCEVDLTFALDAAIAQGALLGVPSEDYADIGSWDGYREASAAHFKSLPKRKGHAGE